MKKDSETYPEKTHHQDEKILVKKCYCCGHINESAAEIQRCHQCKKSFLPLKYFQKIHDIHQNYSQLFSQASELEEDDLIKGLVVLWP